MLKKLLRKIIRWSLEPEKKELVHPTQLKMLELIKVGKDINKWGLRTLGNKIGCYHPQLVKHHKQALFKKIKSGLIDIN